MHHTQWTDTDHVLEVDDGGLPDRGRQVLAHHDLEHRGTEPDDFVKLKQTNRTYKEK